MSLPGLLKSKSQRRLFIWFSVLLVVVCLAAALGVAWGEPGPKWLRDTLNGVLLSLVASGIFALFSMAYIAYFLDPGEVQSRIVICPSDLRAELERVATQAKDYRIYVRSGRHFRAEILPILIKQAKLMRRPIALEVVLLDFRDQVICDKYAHFRKHSSFDGNHWSTEVVQAEVLATVLAVAQAVVDTPSTLRVSLYLSSRLSTFRVEGSSDEIIVTREDPKDFAYKFHHSHPEHSAYMTEFDWIRDDAAEVTMPTGASVEGLLATIFGRETVSVQAEDAAKVALKGKTPYGR